MATYSAHNFNSQHYDDSRPNYPEQYYQALMKYHSQKGDNQLAVDIGCGSGFVAFKLLDYFKHVIGTDPSTTMITQCKNSTSETEQKRIEFLIGTGEQHPPEIESDSVDLITGGECCHWVNHERFFQES